VAIGTLCLESRRSNLHSACYRSHFNYYLAAETSIQTLLIISTFEQAFATWDLKGVLFVETEEGKSAVRYISFCQLETAAIGRINSYSQKSG
jgi:hypothetical protein